IKPITKEELQTVRTKTLASNRKRLRLIIFLFCITFIPILFLGVKALVKMKQRNIAYNIHLIEQQEQERLINYQVYIDKGDYWLNKQQFYNAASCYHKAYQSGINDQEAYKRLIMAYTQECITENRHCKLAVRTILQYFESHPVEKELIEKMELCKAISDSE
ncbi:MAG: hypothetical protein MI922_06975, partial [Bacteroidales bacterium]|nr:hypothetical protein [Bacteroidales bacterium]